VQTAKAEAKTASALFSVWIKRSDELGGAVAGNRDLIEKMPIRL
jgi:hypothetical protein